MASSVSRYLEHLPAVFHEEPFLGRFLLAFERVLTGLPSQVADPPGLAIPDAIEQVVDQIAALIDPVTTRSEFLPWLAGWVATSLHEEWSEAMRRRFLVHVVPLYRHRGTAYALKTLLEIYLDPEAEEATRRHRVEVLETAPPGQPPFPPRYFQVRFSISERNPERLGALAAIATHLIDREKPAHTFYGLRIDYPRLQIANPPRRGADGTYETGVFVGTNTVLGGSFYTGS